MKKLIELTELIGFSFQQRLLSQAMCCGKDVVYGIMILPTEEEGIDQGILNIEQGIMNVEVDCVDLVEWLNEFVCQ